MQYLTTFCHWVAKVMQMYRFKKNQSVIYKTQLYPKKSMDKCRMPISVKANVSYSSLQSRPIHKLIYVLICSYSVGYCF